LFAYSNPNEDQFIRPWIETAPLVFILILLSAAEAYFRPSRQYRDSTRLALMVGGALILASSLVIAVLFLPLQINVPWQRVELGKLMITHQAIYGIAAVWMGLAWCLYRWMPIPWMPSALLRHIALLAIYTGHESTQAFLSNRRIWQSEYLPLVICCSYSILFYFWWQIPLASFDNTQPPPSSDGDIEQAKRAVKAMSRRLGGE
jgi:hypothetical protein